MAVVIPDISPAGLLSQFRGPVIDSKPGYPEVLHLQVRDANGDEWGLSTFDADFSPSDPDVLLGKTVTGAELAPSNTLTIGFSDGSALTVIPRTLEPGEADDDLENWFLWIPDGRYLHFGPEGRWRLQKGSDPW
jgi:hypothetical protein